MLVASVWLVFSTGLVHAVPIIMEQYVALRTVLDGLGIYVSLVAGRSDSFANRLCSVRNELVMRIPIRKLII